MALSGIAIFIIIALIVLFLTGIIVVIVIIAKRVQIQTDIPPNSPIIINFAPHRAQGHAIGLQTALGGDPFSDRINSKFFPLDNPYDSSGDPILKDAFDVPSLKTKRVSLPTGALSRSREIVFLLPERATDLPQGFQNSIFGKMMEMTVESLNVRDSAIESIKAGDAARNRVLRELANGELSEDLFKKLKGFVQEAVVQPVQTEAAQFIPTKK